MNAAILIFLLVFQASPANKRLTAVETLLTAAENGGLCEQRKAFARVHQLGKTAMPSLIDGIGSDRKAYLFALKDPYSSAIYPGEMERHSVGVWALFAIDAILSREAEPKHFGSEDPEKCDFLFATYDRQKYRASIAPTKGKGEAVSHSDMLEIQRIYRMWWEKNKTKSTEQLRADWKNGDRPLKGSDYRW
jgi:hypothetical protein